MAYSAVNHASDMTLGKLLKILSEGGVYNNLPENSMIWDFFLQKKAREDGGRQLQYELMTDYGPSAVQSTGLSDSAQFPAGQRSSLVEGVAQYKDFDMTIEYDLSLEKRTGENLLQYARPLAHEMDAKGLVAGRILSAQCLGDGSGAIGKITRIDAADASGIITFDVSSLTADAGRSHIGWFEEGDIIKCAATASTARVLVDSAAGSPTTAKVHAVDHDAGRVSIKKADGATYELAEDGTWAIGDYIYRMGTTPNDLSAISTNDYNTLSECLVGLESLAANDSRKVNSVIHEGIVTGSRQSASGALLTTKDFQSLVTKIKRRVGNKKYKYEKALMYDRSYDALVELAEANKTFFNTVDFETGARKIGFTHRKDFIEFEPDEFVQNQRIFIMPSDKGVIEYHGRDFQRVDVGGNQFLKPGSTAGQYGKQAVAFMSASGALVVKHPAAIGVLEHFSVS